MKDFAIIIGHTIERPGAASPFGIPPEYFFNSKVAMYLTDVADIYYHDSYRGGYNSMINRTAAHVNQHDYKLILDLHYNSVGRKDVGGTEILHWHTNTFTSKVASDLSEEISKSFLTKNRGAKPRKKSDLGGYLLYKMKDPIITLEPFFGSNKSDCLKFKGKEKQYSELIKDFLRKLP